MSWHLNAKFKIWIPVDDRRSDLLGGYIIFRGNLDYNFAFHWVFLPNVPEHPPSSLESKGSETEKRGDGCCVSPCSESSDSLITRVLAAMKADYESAAVSYTLIDHKRGFSTRITAWPDGRGEHIGDPRLIGILCEQLKEFLGLYPELDDSVPDGVKIYRRLRDTNGKPFFVESVLGDVATVPRSLNVGH